MVSLFALDHNFPTPIVDALVGFQADARLVRIDKIDRRMPELDDWELLLALHHHAEPWDGLITTDSSMLNQGPEVAALIQTKLTLVVAMDAGHNPVKASGLLFAHLAAISQRTRPDVPQLWQLRAVARPHQKPWDCVTRIAEHNDRDTQNFWKEAKRTEAQMATDPLAAV